MATEKLTTRLKNITWTNPQINNHKKSHEQTDQTTDMTQKSRTHIPQILNTICGENCESSWVQVNQEIQMYYLVKVDRNSMAVHLTRSDCEGF
jgi:hypothetical protein